MKTLKKILAGLGILLAIVLIVAFFFVRNVSRKALPDYNKSLKIEGLQDVVEVYRDSFAIPHVYAVNEHDLYMATGYLMAQDRLWQMDFLRRVTQGRLSEILGATTTDADHLLRALRIPEKSQMVLERSDTLLLQCLEAFAAGVNQYIETQGKKLPPEFTLLGYKPEPWLPEHSVNLIGYMAWDLTGSWTTEVVMHKLAQKLDGERFKQLLPAMNRQSTYVHPDYSIAESTKMFTLLDKADLLRNFKLEVFSASNNWAVSGARSITSMPLLSNDMHLGFGSPGIWYPMHQEIEGSLKVSGVALPGAPAIIAGHNEKIAWGMTNLYVDDMDFYVETIDSLSNTYKVNDEWKQLLIREEKIAVKGGDTITRPIRYTQRGPIISDFKKIKDQAISMRWIGNDYSNELRTIYLLNRAGNWNEFRDALSTFIAVSQNVVYADVDGNIGLQTAGGVPIRKEGNGMFISPGDSDRFDWTGIVPFDQLPFTYNPPEGFVASANNRTVGENYPHNIGHWFDLPSRIDRIREMLATKEKFDVEDFKLMLADFRSKHAEKHLPVFLEALQKDESLTPKEKEVLEYLKNWDYQLTADSKAASVFEVMYLNLSRNLKHDEMGDDLYREFIGVRMMVRNLIEHVLEHSASLWVDNVDTPETETFESLVVKSFREALDWLTKTYGDESEDWAWGKVHTLTIEHPLGSVKLLDKIFSLNKGPYPIGGSYHTVNPLAYSFRNPFKSVHGASQRHIYSLSDWTESQVVIPTGISGIPASRHYLDQTPLFVRNEYRNELWTKEKVQSQAKYHAIFSPK